MSKTTEDTDDGSGDAITRTLDARGLRCPMPVIKAEAALRKIAPGSRLNIIVDDPVAVVDIPHFCAEAGHMVEKSPPDVTVEIEQSTTVDRESAMVFVITRGPNSPKDR
ncbi:MAG: sulfurtransferase TusA family protein [Pseudomonadota bacterium]